MRVSTPQGDEVLGGPWQICFVVSDVEEALETWVHRYGVGPWSIWNLGAHNMTDLAVDERPADYGMRIAIAAWGPVEIEVIEPLDEASIYAQSLRDHQGRAHVHHLHCTAPDYDASLALFRARRQCALMSGGFRGARFSYLPTEDDLGTILEIGHHPEAFEFPAPDAVFPADAGSDASDPATTTLR